MHIKHNRHSGAMTLPTPLIRPPIPERMRTSVLTEADRLLVIRYCRGLPAQHRPRARIDVVGLRSMEVVQRMPPAVIVINIVIALVQDPDPDLGARSAVAASTTTIMMIVVLAKRANANTDTDRSHANVNAESAKRRRRRKNARGRKKRRKAEKGRITTDAVS